MIAHNTMLDHAPRTGQQVNNDGAKEVNNDPFDGPALCQVVTHEWPAVSILQMIWAVTVCCMSVCDMLTALELENVFIRQMEIPSKYNFLDP
jgi:hypothetical protein